MIKDNIKKKKERKKTTYIVRVNGALTLLTMLRPKSLTITDIIIASVDPLFHTENSTKL